MDLEAYSRDFKPKLSKAKKRFFDEKDRILNTFSYREFKGHKVCYFQTRCKAKPQEHSFMRCRSLVGRGHIHNWICYDCAKEEATKEVNEYLG